MGVTCPIISNEASTTPQSATFSRSTLFNLPAETIVRQELRGAEYVTLNTFNVAFTGSGRIRYLAGRGGDLLFVNGTQPNVIAELIGNAAARDVFGVGFGANTNDILGSVVAVGHAANGDFAYYYDYLNSRSQDYTVSDVLGYLSVSRPGIAPVYYQGLAG